jgi:hypothetical protein
LAAPAGKYSGSACELNARRKSWQGFFAGGAKKELIIP